LPINTLWGGFEVALKWLELTFRGFSFQHFSISAFARVWLWAACPGCSRFEVQSSGFRVQGSVSNKLTKTLWGGFRVSLGVASG
jgi:hypothetical protein